MRKERKHYSAEEKVAILRRHLLDKVPVSDLCEERPGSYATFAGTQQAVSRTRISQPRNISGSLEAVRLYHHGYSDSALKVRDGGAACTLRSHHSYC